VSYCRFGDDSDVYLYPGDGDWECCGCRISVGDDGRTRLESLPAVLAHLEAHPAKEFTEPGPLVVRVDPRDQLIGAALAEYTDDDEFKRAQRKIAKHA
jgi:hypothetical protein